MRGPRNGADNGLLGRGGLSEAGSPPPARPGAEPAAKQRAARQRARILDAAKRCFIERGFHAASMAHIASTAGMSPGLIYRYFDSKNDIVQAIVERHLETNDSAVTERTQQAEDFCNKALALYERWRRRDDPSSNAALFLELHAEAARDAQIAAIVKRKDLTVSKALTRLVQRTAREQGTHLPANAAQARAVLLQCVIEGLACRAVRDPQPTAQTLRPLLGKVIAALLS